MERLSDKIPVEMENLALGAFFLHISKRVHFTSLSGRARQRNEPDS